MAIDTADAELKRRHRAMWASGDYDQMVGQRSCCRSGRGSWTRGPIAAGTRVLDVAAGTGNASVPAAARGASIGAASDLTPELLEAGRRRADAQGLELEWVQADAEQRPVRRSGRSTS